MTKLLTAVQAYAMETTPVSTSQAIDLAVTVARRGCPSWRVSEDLPDEYIEGRPSFLAEPLTLAVYNRHNQIRVGQITVSPDGSVAADLMKR